MFNYFFSLIFHGKCTSLFNLLSHYILRELPNSINVHWICGRIDEVLHFPQITRLEETDSGIYRIYLFFKEEISTHDRALWASEVASAPKSRVMYIGITEFPKRILER